MEKFRGSVRKAVPFSEIGNRSKILTGSEKESIIV